MFLWWSVSLLIGGARRTEMRDNLVAKEPAVAALAVKDAIGIESDAVGGQAQELPPQTRWMSRSGRP